MSHPSFAAPADVFLADVGPADGLAEAAASIPVFPTLLARGMAPLPLVPLSLALTAYAQRIAKCHPGLFRRLGDHAQSRFVLDPTDLPFVICLAPGGGHPRVTVVRGRGEGVARIAGPLAALLGLVHGAYDGDALFFSRDLVIEGDTAAALALRNAVDDAELDLTAELSTLSGLWAPYVQRIFKFAETRTGVHLSRPEELMTW
ncbi:Putative lipid carrier protein [Phaeobacter sp. CECT 5382]|uniref:ubiquinone anaerobic biosynthesis accessory factor UbiT n=1 Tax=Phaeobacter sp. CECT 5382 TaxID=1712645 RepID=UPI0006DB07FD|nr:SCP2 sterol-binding domain-containing protein [Phaeobacter sp. CECT 5382]CUH86943.1 Putative lipid carrier protein [Phaeobacter sp. CECT 5382]